MKWWIGFDWISPDLSKIAFVSIPFVFNVFTFCIWNRKFHMHIFLTYRNSWTLDAIVGRWTLHAELWTLDAGRCTLDAGRWTLDAGLWTLDCGLWPMAAGLWTLDAGRWTLGSELSTLDVGCYTLDVGLWALDTIVDCFRTKSEASFWFCLIKLLKILWVQISKDLMITLAL